MTNRSNVRGEGRFYRHLTSYLEGDSWQFVSGHGGKSKWLCCSLHIQQQAVALACCSIVTAVL